MADHRAPFIWVKNESPFGREAPLPPVLDFVLLRCRSLFLN
jgi:hypothetical protein